MSLYNRTLESIYACAAKSTSYNAWSFFKDIRQGESLSPTELEAIQWKRLKLLIAYAYENVGLYRELWNQAGVHPKDIHDGNDLLKLPVVDKQTFIDRPIEKKIARGKKKEDLICVQTSGTTGKPLQVFVDPDGYNEQYANLLYGYYLTGWRLGKKVITVRNFSHGDYAGKYCATGLSSEPFPLVRKLVYLLFHRKKLLPPLMNGMKLDERLLEQTLSEVNRVSPFLLEGNGYFWYCFSQFIRDKGKQIKPLGAIEIDEVILSALQKERMAQTLNCKVYDVYGSHELGVVSHGCSEGIANHILSLSYFMEFLDLNNQKEAKEGEVSRVIVTDMTNRVMPLIRYDTGDLAVKINKPCPCGRSYPLMNSIEGRGINAITINGRKYTERFFQDIIYSFDAVTGFQINRGQAGNIKVSLITGQTGLPEKVAQALHRAVGRHIEVSAVPDIPLESSGKARWVKL